MTSPVTKTTPTSEPKGEIKDFDTEESSDWSQQQLDNIEDHEMEITTRKLTSFKFIKGISFIFPSCLSLEMFATLLVGILLILSTMNMTCYSHLMYIPRILDLSNVSELPNNTPANIICKGLHKTFIGDSSNSDNDSVTESHEDHGGHEGHEKHSGHGHPGAHGHGSSESLDGLLFQGFTVPLLFASIISSIICILKKRKAKRNSQSEIKENNPKNEASYLMNSRDPPLTFWTLILVLFPSIYISLEPQFYPLSGFQGIPAWKLHLIRFANPAGIAACFALSLFLIPVSKHSPLNEVFGLSFTQALFFHRISGWISLVFSFLHGFLYLVDYGMNGDRFWSSAFSAMYPPEHCWGWDIFSTQGQTIANHEGCYGYWRNFTGGISLLSFLILAITSLPYVRRKAYWLFISVHIPAAWIMLLGAIAHFRFIALFLIPNIFYYLVTTVPVWVQQFSNARLDSGSNVKSITWIADSNGCCQIKLRFPESKSNKKISLGEYGGVCRICVPEISSIWHPFSVTLYPKGGDISLLIRPLGSFTKIFLNRLLPVDFSGENSGSSHSNSWHLNEESSISNEQERTCIFRSTPSVLVDGIYPAEYRWHRNILHRHDSVLLVAGGVGIVPFLTFLPKMIKNLTINSNDIANVAPLRYLALHWYCRDEGLAKFVCQQYHLADLFDSIVNIDASSTNGDINDNDLYTRGRQEEEQTKKMDLQLHIHITSWQKENNDSSSFIDAIQNVCLHENIIVNAHTGIASSSPSQQTETQGPLYTTFTFKYQEDIRLWTEAVMTSEFKTWKKLLIFILSLGSAMYIHWIYYTRGTSGHPTIPHIYSVFFILAMTLIYGAALFILERYSLKMTRRGFQTISKHDVIVEDNENVRNDVEMSNSFSPAGESSMQNQNSITVAKSLNVSAGRPQMDDVVGCLVNAKDPAAFFCGPEALRTRVKNSINKKRREIHGSFSKPCAFYDEHSDM